jgi:hypothetical protein
MLRSLGIFLVGVLVIVIVVYVLHLLLGMLALPADVTTMANLIVGLLALIGAVILGMKVFRGDVPPLV